MATHPFLDHDGPIPFAHRGGASEAPENTMPAFANAIDLGYRYLETDVHTTADGVLVAFHDQRLDRVTDRSGIIRELDWSTVQQAKVDGREPIPRLAELLDSWPEIRINIDPKHDSAVVPLLAELRAHNALDRVCIGSFSGKRLRHIRDELGPAVCTSIGPVDIVRLVLGQFGIPIGSIGADAVQIPMSQGPIPVTTKRLVDEAHSRGLAVHVWTIDEADQMEHLLDLGVDGIMTDRPVVLRDVFASRNLWY